MSNFNKSHTATFYRRLIRFMPGLPDIVVEAPAEEWRQLANVLSLLEREDRERSKVGCKPAVVRARMKSSTRLQCECFDASTCAVLRDLDESHRCVQKSAESTSM